MGDVFGSRRTRTGEYLDLSMKRIAQEEGAGVLVYLRLEDMGQRFAFPTGQELSRIG